MISMRAICNNPSPNLELSAWNPARVICKLNLPQCQTPVIPDGVVQVLCEKRPLSCSFFDHIAIEIIEGPYFSISRRKTAIDDHDFDLERVRWKSRGDLVTPLVHQHKLEGTTIDVNYFVACE
uniref:Uncharacterized protein n=1 Tax=Opuntia streptacantha TaxID=393608 RepID=A0A7C9DFH4_OPUST